MSMEPQNVSVKCPCGTVHRFRAQHYDRVIVECGRKYWVLQPRRAGAYVLKPWPGPNLTREEMGGGKSAAQIVRKMISDEQAAREVDKILPL